ncbi:MAG: Ig-like domain-containing protein [Longimicrobiaceae bacterium]
MLGTSLALTGCADQAAIPTLAVPEAARPALSDGAHGGTAGFYFLPPMLPQPGVKGTFDPNLAPTVTLCVMRAGRCAATLAEYTRGSGPGAERVQLKSSESHYLVNWDTKLPGYTPGDTVRVAVSVAGTALGFADVVLLGSGSGAKNVDTNEFIALVDGRTLPILFRIETGIAASITVSPAAATVAPGETRQFTARVTDLHGNVLDRPVSWSADPCARITATGLATGVAAGSGTVTATSGPLSATASLTVEAPPAVPSQAVAPEAEAPPLVVWTPTGTGGQGNAGVWGSSASDVYMANWVGVWHFDGTAWSFVPELEWHGTLDVYGFGADDVWAVGPSGRILHYDGHAWSGARFDGDRVYGEPLGVWDNPPRNFYLRGVWGSAANDLFVAGDSGTVLHWNGAAWSRMATGTRAELHRVWGSSATDVYVSGENGTLLHYDGSAWSRVAVPSAVGLERIWGSSASDVYVGGAAGTLLHYDGASWSRVAIPVDPTFTVHAVWGTAADNVYVAGSGGFVLHWDGASWVREESGRPEQILGLWGPNGTDVFASMAGGWVTRRPER